MWSPCAEIAAPTLILAGRDDFIMPPAHGAERLHAGIAGSMLKIFERSGHYPFIEEHGAFIAAVQEWLAQTIP